MNKDLVALNLSEISEQLEALASRTAQLGELVSGSPASDHHVPPGRRLARARAKANMTQAGLAKASGVAVNTIINFEKGHTTPRTRTLMSLAESVGIPWEVLRAEDDHG